MHESLSVQICTTVAVTTVTRIPYIFSALALAIYYLRQDLQLNPAHHDYNMTIVDTNNLIIEPSLSTSNTK